MICQVVKIRSYSLERLTASILTKALKFKITYGNSTDSSVLYDPFHLL